jgi:DNA-binding MarR family transcriptional regulator
MRGVVYMSEQDMVKRLLVIMGMIRKVNIHRLNIAGLNKSEYIMLTSIGEQAVPECGMSGLSSRHNISRPAISQMIGILEKKGLVERRVDGRDRRVVRISVTEAGEKTLKLANSEFERFLHRVVEKLGENDVNELIRLGTRLYRVLEELLRESRGESI